MPTSYLFASDQLLEPMNRQVLGHLQDIGTRQAASTERMGEAILQGYTAIADVRMKQEAFAQRAQAMQVENQLASQQMQLRAQELELRRQEFEFDKVSKQDEQNRTLIEQYRAPLQTNPQTGKKGRFMAAKGQMVWVDAHEREVEESELDIDAITRIATPMIRDQMMDPEEAYKSAFSVYQSIRGGKRKPEVPVPLPSSVAAPQPESRPAAPAPKKLVTGAVEEPRVKLPPATKKYEEGGAMSSYDPEFFTSAMDKFTEWALADKDGAFTKMRMKDRAYKLEFSDGEPWFASKGERSQFVRALFIKEAAEVEDAFIRYKAQTAGVPVDIARTLWRNTVNDAIGRGDAKSLEPIRKEFEQSLKARLAYKGFNLGETKK